MTVGRKSQSDRALVSREPPFHLGDCTTGRPRSTEGLLVELLELLRTSESDRALKKNWRSAERNRTAELHLIENEIHRRGLAVPKGFRKLRKGESLLLYRVVGFRVDNRRPLTHYLPRATPAPAPPHMIRILLRETLQSNRVLLKRWTVFKVFIRELVGRIVQERASK